MSLDVEITQEMLETAACAQLYREDPILQLRKIIGKKLTNKEMDELYHSVIKHPDFERVKQETIDFESQTLVDENVDTIMLYYNKLLKQAQYEGKYDVIVKILKEIRQLKAVENEQMKFEIRIKVEEPKGGNNNG